jgi:hypothetical protein
VTLSSDTSAASIPAKVTIPSGATSSSFSIASSPVSAKTVATINASRGASLSATITLNPAGLSGLEVSTAKVKINGSALATVTLDSPAGPQGAIIALASSNAGVASVPATVIVPAGAKSAAFNITAGTISTETAVTISATLNGVTKTVPISVVVPGFTLATQTDSAATIIAGQTAIYNLSAAGTNDFSGTVALTCSGAPQGSTCSVTPNPLTVSGAAASSFTVSVTTTARVSTAAAAGSIKPNLPGGSGGAALFWIGLLAMTTFVASMRIVPVRRQLGVVAACAMLFAVAGLTGCGGGGTGSRQTPSFSPPSQTGTPAGTYAVVVTGVSGSQTQTLQLTLKVN